MEFQLTKDHEPLNAICQIIEQDPDIQKDIQSQDRFPVVPAPHGMNYITDNTASNLGSSTSEVTARQCSDSSSSNAIGIFYNQMMALIKNKSKKVKAGVKRLRNYSAHSSKLRVRRDQGEKRKRKQTEIESTCPMAVENESISNVQKDAGTSLEEKLKQLEEGLETHQLPPKRNWTKQREQINSKWEEQRGFFLSTSLKTLAVPTKNALCDRCNIELSTLFCSDCCNVLLCTSCDKEIHASLPFHDRQHWGNGYFQPLATNNTAVLINESVCIQLKDITLFDNMKCVCPLCNSYTSVRASSSKRLVLINEKDREEKLTEHLLFWNEQKVKKMENYMCQRLKKLEELKCTKKESVDGYLCSLEVNSSLDEITDLWKEEVQSHANVASETTASEYEASIFKKFQTLKEVEAIRSFLHTTSSSISKLTNNQELHIAASKVLESVDIDSLRKDVNSWKENATRQNLNIDKMLENGKNQLAKKMAQDLQITIEVLSNSIDRRKREINKFAGSSKEKNRLRIKNEKEKALLQTTVADFNEICTQFQGELITDVNGRQFPWSRHCSDASFKDKRDFVDRAMEVRRLEEETELIKTEMKNFCVFYDNKISCLKEKLKHVETNDQEEQNQENKGIKALLEKGIYCTQIKLKTAIQHFNSALGKDYESEFLEKDEDEMHSYEEDDLD